MKMIQLSTAYVILSVFLVSSVYCDFVSQMTAEEIQNSGGEAAVRAAEQTWPQHKYNHGLAWILPFLFSSKRV